MNRHRLANLSTLAVVLTTAAVPAFGQMGPARVIVAPVVEQEVAAGQPFVGSVMPLRTSTVGSAAAGRVETFLVNEGDRVKKGQPICKLRTRIIEAEVASAEAERKGREAELEELVNGSRPEEIDQARARLALAEATAEFRRAKRKRTTTLLRSGVSQEEAEESISLSNQADSALREATAALALLVAGPRKEKIAQARAHLLGQQAEVDRLTEQLERHTVFAPFDGYVSAEHTEQGAWLKQGDPIAEIVELDVVEIEVPVPEDYVGYLTEGASVRIEVGSLPREAFTGTVSLVVPKANPRTRTFPVKVRVENRRVGNTVLLKAGMFARATLPVGMQEKGLLVPKDALVLGGATRMVYVVDAETPDAMTGKVRPVPVELGVASGGLIQVRGDLKPGQRVVVQGNERVFPGIPVQIVAPDKPKE